jgi:formyltetrahydrofolate hydrolase
MEKNVGKSWHTTTLVPSSKLVSVVKCWDSSNVIQLPSIFSLCHAGNIVNEEEFYQQVERNYYFWKHDYIHESQGKEKQTCFFNLNEKFCKVWKLLHFMNSLDLFLTQEVFKLQTRGRILLKRERMM